MHIWSNEIDQFIDLNASQLIHIASFYRYHYVSKWLFKQIKK